MHSLVLASSSPRRRYLMNAVGFEFTVMKPDVEEDFPADLVPEKVAAFLAEKKANYFAGRPGDNIYVTADTVVILGSSILNKPSDRDEAINMLTRLSGNTHTVITAVCILSRDGLHTFQDTTLVTFNPLRQSDIEFYVDNFSPYDKAGSYGAQDCLPPGVNPCSPDEVAFLTSINKLELIDQSKTSQNIVGLHAIHSIDGSYFNVMGLPIHRVYERLQAML